MKKVHWDALPLATATKKGLMDSRNVIGYNNSFEFFKLSSSHSGYLINTSIEMTLACNILVRITEHNFNNSNPTMKIIQLYPTIASSNKATTVGATTSVVEVLNNNGNISLYVTPGNTSGYSALVEIFAINTARVIINPNMSLIATSKPAGATVVSTL